MYPSSGVRMVQRLATRKENQVKFIKFTSAQILWEDMTPSTSSISYGLNNFSWILEGKLNSKLAWRGMESIGLSCYGTPLLLWLQYMWRPCNSWRCHVLCMLVYRQLLVQAHSNDIIIEDAINCTTNGLWDKRANHRITAGTQKRYFIQFSLVQDRIIN